MGFDHQEWAEVVPLTRMKDAERAFETWLRAHDLTVADIGPENIVKRIHRVVGGSAIDVFIRRSVLDDVLSRQLDQGNSK